MKRIPIAALLAILAACSTIAAPDDPSSTGHHADEGTDTTESETTALGEESSAAGESETGESETDDPEPEPTWDWGEPDLPDPDEESEGSTESTETGEPTAPACCFCISDHAWECFGWNGGEQSCLMWNGGGFTNYDPDCPEAWTGQHDDDWLCEAACG